MSRPMTGGVAPAIWLSLSLLPALSASAQVALPSSKDQLQFTLDPVLSKVHARVGFLGLASKTARFPKVSGRIVLNPKRLDTIQLNVDLDATALEAGDSVTLSRLKGPDFFDVEHYPGVHFVGRAMTMTGPVTAQISGELTAKGVTRPVTLAVGFAKPPASATGQEPIQLTAQTKIDRTEFGMNAYRFIVAKTVTITINAQMVPR
jgi:polyisoprenoid-binding protein YceI